MSDELFHRRYGRRPLSVVYVVVNLLTGERYVGKNVHRQVQPFEASSYYGSGTVVTRWKRQGVPLLKGILHVCTKASLLKTEREAIDRHRETYGSLLVNREDRERRRSKQPAEYLAEAEDLAAMTRAIQRDRLMIFRPSRRKAKPPASRRVARGRPERTSRRLHHD